MKKINTRKVITTVGIVVGSLILFSIIYIKLLPLPANMAFTIHPIVLTTTNIQRTYIFEGRNTITCYNRAPEYNIDAGKYIPMPIYEEYLKERYTERRNRLNVFQKIRVIRAAKNLKRAVYTTKGAYSKYKTIDTPDEYGNIITLHKDGLCFYTDILIEGQWSNRYAALCDDSLIDLFAATMLGCPFPKEERWDLEEWVRKHWWHMEKMD